MSSNDHSHDDVPTPALQRRTVLKAAAAASALVGAGTGLASASGNPHRLVLEGIADDVDYRVEVSGEIEPGARAEDGDEISDGTVVGSIQEGKVDDFWFSGEIVAFEVTGGGLAARVEKDAAKKATREYRDMVIEAHDKYVEYHVEVTGKIERGSRAEERGDVIRNGSSVRGAIEPGNVDDFRFTGKIKRFDVSHEDVTVTVDGEVLYDS